MFAKFFAFFKWAFTTEKPVASPTFAEIMSAK